MQLEEIRPLKPRKFAKTYIIQDVQPNTVPPVIENFYLQDDGRVYQPRKDFIEVLMVVGEYYFVSNTIVMNVNPRQ